MAEFKIFVVLLGETGVNYKINFTEANWCREEIQNMCLLNPRRKLTCMDSRPWYITTDII